MTFFSIRNYTEFLIVTKLVNKQPLTKIAVHFNRVTLKEIPFYDRDLLALE